MEKPLKKIPRFETEAEERAFWEDESNCTTEYFDWSKAKLVTFPNLKPSPTPTDAEKTGK